MLTPEITEAIEATAERVADKASRAALHDVLVMLGINLSDPASVAEWHRGREWLRRAAIEEDRAEERARAGRAKLLQGAVLAALSSMIGWLASRLGGGSHP